MGIFFKISDKDLVIIKNKIFVEKGIPALKENGFQKSPFSTSWFGKDDLKGYTYELCRVSNQSFLEMITVFVVKGDRYIQTYLNIFELSPPTRLLNELNNYDGVQFHLPINSSTRMRLRVDGYNGIPIIRKLFGKEHKIRSYYSRTSFEKRVQELSNLIVSDFNNIDLFVSKWYKMHKPLVTDWNGHIIF